ncbi:MAG: hypothetical protein GC200_05210 [Tepidisphaera sp.]|nr:hypothetical protein [Tepidisphaera sp.]
MWDRIKTILVVTGITCLIWIFAESEGLRTTDVDLQIQLDAEPGADRVVEVLDPPAPSNVIRISASLEGSADAIDLATRRARKGPLLISPGLPGFSKDPGEQTVSMSALLSVQPELRGLGLTFKKTEPENVKVFVDSLATRQLPTRLLANGGDIDGPADIKPDQVTVSGPARAIAKIPKDAAATITLDADTFSRLVAGRRETLLNMRLSPPPEIANLPRVKLSPATADVNLTVRSRLASIKLGTVPVHIRIAPAEMAKFDVSIREGEQTLTDVTVTGPADFIKQVEAKAIPIVAEVPLSYEELERRIPQKDAVFTLTPQLPTPVKFEVANRTVHLTIKPREAKN